jgi:hypothetical protein
MVEIGGMAASREARLTTNRHGGLSGGSRGFPSGCAGAEVAQLPFLDGAAIPQRRAITRRDARPRLAKTLPRQSGRSRYSVWSSTMRYVVIADLNVN